MSQEIRVLTSLALKLQDRMSLDELLELIVQRSAELVGTARVSLRLLDPSRTRLLATCRRGANESVNLNAEFRLGEGLLGWIAQHGQPIRTGDATRDPRYQWREDITETVSSFLGVPLICGQTCIGVLSVLSPEPHRFDAQDEEFLILLAGICTPHLEIARLSRLSQVDPLTGTLNRRGLEQEHFATEDALSVALVDIDRFKRINDAYGHAIGDEVLKRVAKLLGSVLRAKDSVIRYGGEEFVLILPDVDLYAAERIAERARVAVEQQPIEAGGVSVRATISIGVGERRQDEPLVALIERADQALYYAKRAGRNRVMIVEPSGPTPSSSWTALSRN